MKKDEKQMTEEDIIKNVDRLHLSGVQKEYCISLIDLAYKLGQMEQAAKAVEIVDKYEN